MALVFLLLCGCNAKKENSETRFLFNTIATLTADCDEETLLGAFSLCEYYDALLSRTNKESDVYRLNNQNGPTKISEHTAKLIERSIYYSNITHGKFDITIYPVSYLWDFEKEIIPSRDEIAEALKSVDYQDILIKEDTADLGGKKIDLGGIGKGYIADRLLDYFREKNTKSGIINLGGNIIVFGERDYNIGIKKPFTADEVLINVSLSNRSIVTSGIYERYIERSGQIYHHILDTETGYGVQNELLSASVIADSSLDCDALSTCCLLLGLEAGKALIENTADTEAVFIDKDYNIYYTSGLSRQDNSLYLK